MPAAAQQDLLPLCLSPTNMSAQLLELLSHDWSLAEAESCRVC